MTLRLPPDLMDDLSVIAECDGETVSEAIRAAVSAWVASRRADSNVQEALARRIERAQRLLDGAAPSHEEVEK